ncbi:PTS transporter subunit EIIC [Escherichia coli]
MQQFLAKFATIFTPLIPGFIAAGLLLGIATLIATVMHVPADAQGTLPDALNFMKVFSKGLFTFLVILVGYNAAQAFGGTGVMAQLLPHSFCSVITPLQPPVTTPVFTISLVCPSIRAAIFIGVLIAAWACARIEGMVRRLCRTIRHAADLVNHPADHRYACVPDHYAAGWLVIRRYVMAVYAPEQ